MAVDKFDWELEEWESIHQRRAKAFGIEPPKDARERPKNLIGLALSGGGIRSALYNDGFLQGLSHRGLLRFVDYLASVSGGGYIAGHLIAQADASSNNGTKKKNRAGFHDDAGESQTQRWHLGRDPSTGEVDSKRLAAVGGYLSRPLEVLPAYLWSCFFSAAFYIGFCGVFATLAALFWRSFDDPLFRIMYLEVLGIRVGNEFLIAFIPAIVLMMFYIMIEIGFSSLRWVLGSKTWSLQRRHIRVRAFLFVSLVLACLTSIAIFLGNGTTNIQSAASGSLYLNHYAQWLAAIAGTLQILVFFGSDRLFRSERQEAKSWQKHVQRFIAVGVTLFLVFSMIHWMGRENISKYADHREPYLEVGDISDWQTLEDVFDRYQSAPEHAGLAHLRDRLLALITVPVEDSLNLADTLPKELRSQDRWQQTLSTRRWGTLSDASDQGPVDPKPWMLEERILGAAYAYKLAMFTKETDPIPKYADLQEDADVAGSATAEKELTSVAATVNFRFNKLRSLLLRQDKHLAQWKPILNDPEFTAALLAGVLIDPPASGGTTSVRSQDATLPMPLHKKLKDLLVADTLQLSSGQKKSILHAANRLELIERRGSDLSQLSQSDREAYAEVNRLLLEAIFPRAIRSKDIPSTFVVPPHDQQARRSWLGFWLLSATIGAIGGVFRHQIATVFQFYRRQLGSNFLVQNHRRTESKGEVQLHELEPTADGLPYPLMLAASMEPVTINGGYTIASRTFMFTPKYCGDLEDDNNRIRSDQVALSRKEKAEAVTLADAVTLSGAAVTAFMTTNRCLSLLVDFFNTGLGMQVYRTEKTNASTRRANNVGWLGVTSLSLFAAYVIYRIMDGDWPSTITAFALSWIVGSCVINEIGVPHFLRTLIVPREVGPRVSDKERQRSAKSFYVADGGFTDYLGVSALLKRRCELIVVSDAGANVGDNHLGTLAKMCEKTSAEMGIRFLDLDHEAPIDFGRLLFDEQRLVHQPYICMRVRYPDCKEGLLIYCQMAICESDPIEIQQIRHRFPTFPDEPTANQFYSEEQVSAYRLLGYHIASKLCREMERWCIDQKDSSGSKDSSNTEPAFVSGSKQFNQFQEAMIQHSSAKWPRIDNGVPHFAVLQERLLTAYRLACYEEVSYRKDDIFNEAIWPMSTYAFPNFHRHVRSLAADPNPDVVAESWLRIYESSADIRSVYRKAVLEDINVMESEAESFCAAILWRLAKVNQAEFTSEGLLAAHLSVMATTCQEVHRGRPHSAFQIGGRRKLLHLCRSLAGTISKSLSRCPSTAADLQLRDILGSIVAEIAELERSVFQGSEHVTTISFVQCVCVMWGRLARGENRQNVDIEDVAERGRMAFKSGRATPTESRMVKSRHELDRGLRRVELDRILDTLTRLWYLGYFNVDAAEMLNEQSFNGFGFAGFDTNVRVMTQNDIANRTRIWLRQCDSNPQIRCAYVDAIAIDSTEVAADSDAKVTDLWYDFRQTATSIRPDIRIEELLAAHFAALATAYVVRSSDTTRSGGVKFAAGGRRRLLETCNLIGSTVAAKIPDSDAKAVDSGLTQAMSRVVHQLSTIDRSVLSDWDPEHTGQFARSVINVWAATVRGDRSAAKLRFNTAKAEDAHEAFAKQGDLTGREGVHDLDTRLSESIQSDSAAAATLLIELWYVALVSRSELETAIELRSTSRRTSSRPTSTKKNKTNENEPDQGPVA